MIIPEGYSKEFIGVKLHQTGLDKYVDIVFTVQKNSSDNWA